MSAAEMLEQRRVVVAVGARMDLQHEPVIEAHLGHSGQHLALGTRSVPPWPRPCPSGLGVELLGLRIREIGGAGRGVAMIGGGGATFLDRRAACDGPRDSRSRNPCPRPSARRTFRDRRRSPRTPDRRRRRLISRDDLAVLSRTRGPYRASADRRARLRSRRSPRRRSA